MNEMMIKCHDMLESKIQDKESEKKKKEKLQR